jgi:tRNA-binding protein
VKEVSCLQSIRKLLQPLQNFDAVIRNFLNRAGKLFRKFHSFFNRALGMSTKQQADYSAFSSLDIRVGVILSVELAATKKPTYRLSIDFGGAIGIKRSCGAYCGYAKEYLVGKQIIAVVNFMAKKMGPELSEVLVLGVPGLDGETVFITPDKPVEPGVEAF